MATFMSGIRLAGARTHTHSTPIIRQQTDAHKDRETTCLAVILLLSQTDHYLTADCSVTGKRPKTQSTGNEDTGRPIQLFVSAQEKGAGAELTPFWCLGGMSHYQGGRK